MPRTVDKPDSRGFGGDHCLAPSRSVDGPVDGAAGRYVRLFPELPALAAGENDVVLALGSAGGICDGGESCEDATETAAGWPLFGQFIAHDITADRSPLTARAELSSAVNFRSPRADLECLYGSGQVGSPFLYTRDDPALLLLGRNDRGEENDVPRNAEAVALIGDPRNDSHIIVSQLHVAMIKVHNRLVELARERGVAPANVFETARRETVWHYQWVIVNDYLTRLVGAELVDSILEDGQRFYRHGGAPLIPFEFADAAFRCGHSQVRDSFELNSGAEALRLFPDLIGFATTRQSTTVDVRPASAAVAPVTTIRFTERDDDEELAALGEVATLDVVVGRRRAAATRQPVARAGRGKIQRERRDPQQ